MASGPRRSNTEPSPEQEEAGRRLWREAYDTPLAPDLYAGDPSALYAASPLGQAQFALSKMKLGDFLPPMAAAEGITKAGQAFERGDYGTGALEGGLAALDIADPSPISWSALAGLGMLGDMGKVYGKKKITQLDPSMQVGQRISQRVPTPTQQPDVHLRDDIDVNLDAMRLNPESFETNMKLLQTSTALPFGGMRNPDVIAGKAMEHIEDNLRHIKANTPQSFFDRSGNWYKGANALANDISQTHGIPIEASAGVLARLSPKWDWLMNVENADRLVDIWKNQRDTRWTPEMSRVANPNIRKKLEGTRLGDLDSTDKALWIRTFDAAHNPQVYRGLTPEGTMGDIVMDSKGKLPKKHVMQSNVNLRNAINMLEDPRLENISRQLGTGGMHKIRNFYNNIADPFHGNDITMDTHAIAADMLSPFGSGAREVDMNFGGLGTSISQGAGGTYGLHADAYRNVADELGILPSELQSPVWETIRETFTNKTKNAPIVEEMWKDAKRGYATPAETRDRIMDYFMGYRMPSWFEG